MIVEEDEEMMSDGSNVEQKAKRRRLDLSPAPSASYEPSIADDDEVPGLSGVPAAPTAAHETGAPHDLRGGTRKVGDQEGEAKPLCVKVGCV